MAYSQGRRVENPASTRQVAFRSEIYLLGNE